MNTTELIQLLKNLGIQKLRLRGNNVSGLCPNHSERRPSWGMRIDPPYVHNCYSCGYRGTLRTLLLDQGWSWKRIQDQFGDTLGRGVGKALSWNVRKTKEPYSLETLWGFSEDNPKMWRYLAKRGIPLSTARIARLLWDTKQSRLVFPWYEGPKLVGATGRASIDGSEIPKIIAYGNFKKGEHFYLPGSTLIPYRPVILVEGEIDALKVYTMGRHNVAALGQGQFSSHHLEILLTLPVKSVFLFFDDDATGRALTNNVSRQVETLGICPYLVPYLFTLKDPGAMDSVQIHNCLDLAKRLFTRLQF